MAADTVIQAWKRSLAIILERLPLIKYIFLQIVITYHMLICLLILGQSETDSCLWQD